MKEKRKEKNIAIVLVEKKAGESEVTTAKDLIQFLKRINKDYEKKGYIEVPDSIGKKGEIIVEMIPILRTEDEPTTNQNNL